MSQRQISAKQTRLVLWSLKYNGHITAIGAEEDHGIMRLGARIYDLRKAGWHIKSEMVPVQTRHGMRKVAQYTLVEMRRQVLFDWRADK